MKTKNSHKKQDVINTFDAAAAAAAAASASSFLLRSAASAAAFLAAAAALAAGSASLALVALGPAGAAPGGGIPGITLARAPPAAKGVEGLAPPDPPAEVAPAGLTLPAADAASSPLRIISAKEPELPGGR